MRTNMRLGLCADVRVDMRIDIRLHMCADIRIDMRTDVHKDVCRCTRPLKHMPIHARPIFF